MSQVPKKVLDRMSRTIPKFQRILKIAKERDFNEADTVSVIGDILSEVFGFNKYLDITSEYAIRGAYCDLALKVNGKIQYLIEAKGVGLDLKEHHLRQIVNYVANKGIQWAVLTNGILWEIYRIRFERPVGYDLVCQFNFLEISPRKTEDQEKLFIPLLFNFLRNSSNKIKDFFYI